VNSPGVDETAGAALGGAKLAGPPVESGSAEVTDAGAFNVLVNPPGPDPRDDDIETAGIAGSAAGAAGGAPNMLVNSPGLDEAAGVAAGTAGLSDPTVAFRSAEVAGGGALNILVNSPGPDAGDAGAGGVALNMLVNSPGLDELPGATGVGGIADRIA
jgi:hypothetical protein